MVIVCYRNKLYYKRSTDIYSQVYRLVALFDYNYKCTVETIMFMTQLDRSDHKRDVAVSYIVFHFQLFSTPVSIHGNIDCIN